MSSMDEIMRSFLLINPLKNYKKCRYSTIYNGSVVV